MNDLKISTELASAVLGKEVTKCSLISTARSSINITYFEDSDDFNTVWKEWNIYEFASKCKEWAIRQGYIIETSYEGIVESTGSYCISRVFYDGDKIYDNYTDVQDYQKEPEAIVKACNWILKEL